MNLTKLCVVIVWVAFYTSMFWYEFSIEACNTPEFMNFLSGATCILGTIGNLIAVGFIIYNSWDKGEDVF